jgi:radical SAM-linked protein
MVANKVRLRFSKGAHLRLVSHHDLMRCFERALRRAGLPIAHSQGFNPRPKVVFPLPMALGIEGRREVVELELSNPMTAEEVREQLASVTPAGLEFLSAKPLDTRKPGQAVAAVYEFALPEDRRNDAAARLAEFCAAVQWHYDRVRPGRTSRIDLRAQVIHTEIDLHGVLRFRMSIDPAGSARAEDFLEALGLRDLLMEGGILVRSDVELADEASPTAVEPTVTKTHNPESMSRLTNPMV